MEATELLKVTTDVKIHNRILINPNDAYDIGILSNQAQFKLYYPDQNGTIIADPGITEFIMDPKQAVKLIILDPALYQKLGKPQHLRLMKEDGKILVQFE